MLSIAKSANVDLPHPQTLLRQLAQKIPFINSEKNFQGVNNVHTNIRVRASFNGSMGVIYAREFGQNAQN